MAPVGRLVRVLAKLTLALVAMAVATLGACRWQAASRETSTRQQAAPGSGRFVRAGDVDMFIQEQGSSTAPVVVFMHGMGAWSTLTSGEVFRRIDADVYHSQEPTLASRLAQRAVPGAVHVVTCRDPRSLADHFTEWRWSGARRRLAAPATWLYEASPWVRRAVRHADAVFCASPHLAPKVRRLYGDALRPVFLPSPVDLPAEPPVKADAPTVLYLRAATSDVAAGRATNGVTALVTDDWEPPGGER